MAKITVAGGGTGLAGYQGKQVFESRQIKVNGVSSTTEKLDLDRLFLNDILSNNPAEIPIQEVEPKLEFADIT